MSASVKVSAVQAECHRDTRSFPPRSQQSWANELPWQLSGCRMRRPEKGGRRGGWCGCRRRRTATHIDPAAATFCVAWRRYNSQRNRGRAGTHRQNVSRQLSVCICVCVCVLSRLCRLYSWQVFTSQQALFVEGRLAGC
jgi:hypothetical protein